MKTINETTLCHDLCIGCGICSSVCHNKAIEMRMTKELYQAPFLNNDLCVKCGLCSRYCPNSENALFDMSKKVATLPDFNLFGLDEAKFYLMRANDSNIEKSASGGIATYIAKKMLKGKIIDAVIHAEMVCGDYKEHHYIGAISFTEEEIERRRGSFYAPINFGLALDCLKKLDVRRVLFIGTPCAVRGVTNLLKNNKNYGISDIYTIALSCSHNVNGMLSSYLADSMDIPRGTKWKVNFRDKVNAKNATNFNTAFYGEDGSTLQRVNRFQSQFTLMWRNYVFSMNCCNSCSDFWGKDADISVKDAWGKWSKDEKAKSIVIVRKPRLMEEIFDSECTAIPLSLREIVECQKETVVYKQGAARKRMKKCDPKYWNRIDLLHRIHYMISKYSKKMYIKMLDKSYSERLLHSIRIVQLVMDYSPSSIKNKIVKRLKKG